MKLYATLAVAVCLILGSAVQAETYYSRDDGAWNNNANWHTHRTDGDPTTSAYPTTGDIAYIQATHDIDVASTSACAQLIIEDAASGDPAVLDLQASGVLSISSSVDVERTADVPGQFNFSAASGTQGKLLAAGAEVTLDGLFDVTGAQGGELDEFSGTNRFRLLSTGEIRCTSGKMRISCYFENDGTCTANGTSSGYDMEFTYSCVIRDESTGLWQVTAANSKMIFDHDDSTMPDLSGDSDFNVQAGTMQFKESLRTAGGARILATIQADAGASFEATGAY
jgi:hypothetical protein